MNQTTETILNIFAASDDSFSEDGSQRETKQKLIVLRNELIKIFQQPSQYALLLQKMNEMELDYINRIQQMRFTNQRIKQKCQYQFEQVKKQNESLRNQNQILKQKINQLNQNINNLNEKCSPLQKQIQKYKKMVINQQSLIEDYHKNAKEQLLLQKQLLKTSFAAQQLKLKHQMSRAINEMQRNYDNKLKENSRLYKQKLKRHQKDILGVESLISNGNKQNNQQLTQIKLNKLISGYSTQAECNFSPH